MKLGLAIVLFISVAGTVAQASEVNFKGTDRRTNELCEISYSLDEATGSVSGLRLTGTRHDQSGQTADMTISQAPDSTSVPVVAKRVWLSFRPGWALTDETKRAAGSLGAWAQSILRVVGDLKAPRGFYEAASYGRVSSITQDIVCE